MTETQKPSDQVKITESKDGSVHITQPKGKRHHGVTVLLDSDDIAREQVGGFVSFLREKAVVGLAVGFIIGQQAQGLVKQLVDSFITPILNVLLGQDLMKKQFFLGSNDPTHVVTWGKFLYALIDFLFVLVFIYAIIKLFNLDKLDKPKKDKK